MATRTTSTDRAPSVAAIQAARHCIADVVVETPSVRSRALTDRVGTAVHLKLENLQVTGSFKVRGAANKLMALSDREKAQGVVTCSSGNHGRAVAYVAERLGISAVVCVPDWVDRSKLTAIRSHRAEVLLSGASYDAAEARALEIQQERGLTYVPPFDDPHVITGQGTIGLELLEQIPTLDTVLVPLSGGGLVGGIALALKAVHPALRVIAVSAANARVMYESLRVGKPMLVAEEPTIANALSGGIGVDNRYTFALVRDLVDEHMVVSEDLIRAAIRFAAAELKLVVEGGGAVGIAALLETNTPPVGHCIAVVVSGGNLDSELLAQLLT